MADLDPGDVLMVRRVMTDKTTKQPFTWRFFALVMPPPGKRLRVSGIYFVRVGDPENKLWTRTLDDPNMVVYLLEPHKWPEGIHVARTKAILQGDIDIL